MSVNYVDILITCFLFYGFIRGLFNGFFVELTSAVALFIGAVGSFYFSPLATKLIQIFFDWKYLKIVSFILTFITIIIIVIWAGKILTKLAKIILLGWINRVLGGLFGFFKWLIICTIIVWVTAQINSFINFIPQNTIDNSIFFYPLQDLGNSIFEIINDKRLKN